MPILRGVAAILFGVFSLFSPGAGLFALVVLFGAYALVDGVLSLSHAIRPAVPGAGPAWPSLVIEGVAGIIAGIATFAWPGITAVVLLFIIAAWAVVTGIAELVTAIRLRKTIRHEWLMALGGVASTVFGVLLFLYPGAGALVLVTWIAIYAILFGAILIGLGFRLRSFMRVPERHIPIGGTPTPA